MKTKVLMILLAAFFLYQVTTQVEAGMFGGPYKTKYINYRYKGETGVVKLNFDKVTMTFGFLSGGRRVDKPGKLSKFDMVFDFLSEQNPLVIKVLDVRFIEKINGVEGRIFWPYDVHDDEMQNARPATIQFLEEARKLPIIWNDESNRSFYMDFPPIPEEITEGELLVKLEIEKPNGEKEMIERRFPMYQESHIGDSAVID